MSVLSINLPRSVPEETETSTIMGALTQLNQRDAAIVGASYLEQALELRMKAHFRQGMSIDDEAMIWGKAGSGTGGLLAGTAAKILIAYAAGLIGAETKNDLWLVCSIRNVFTSRLEIQDFDDPLLCAEVNELSDNKSFAGRMRDIEGLDGLMPSTFESFCLAVETLYKGLVADRRNH